MNKKFVDEIVTRTEQVLGLKVRESKAGLEAMAAMLHDSDDGLIVAYMLGFYIEYQFMPILADTLSKQEKVKIFAQAMGLKIVESPGVPNFLPEEIGDKGKAWLEAVMQDRNLIPPDIESN